MKKDEEWGMGFSPVFLCMLPCNNKKHEVEGHSVGCPGCRMSQHFILIKFWVS